MLHSALGEYAQILNWNVTHLCTGPHLLYWSRPLLPTNGEEVNDQLCCVLNKILTTFVLSYCLCQKAHELNVQLLWQPSSFFVLKQQQQWWYLLKEKKVSRLCVVQKKMDPGMFIWVVLLHQQHPKIFMYKALYHCIGGNAGILDIGSVKIVRKSIKYGTLLLTKN